MPTGNAVSATKSSQSLIQDGYSRRASVESSTSLISSGSKNLGTRSRQTGKRTFRSVTNCFKEHAAWILQAAATAFVISLSLAGLAAIYAWTKGIHYHEGLAARSLALGAILLPVLTCALMWESRNDRRC